MSAKPNSRFAITKESLQHMAAELAETASHPEFLQMIQAVQLAPIDNKRAVAEDVARVEQVASRGIPVPATFRITTRTFEEPEPLIPIDDGHSDPPTVTFDGECGSVAYQSRVVSVRERPLVPQPISNDVVQAEIRKGIEAIGEFVASAAFQTVLAEMAALDEDARSNFVVDELLEPTRRADRDLVVPNGMQIQRSQFADGRPTLFCVSKVLPLAYPWHKVTITFDNA
jgi:hypothetical protein